MLTKSLESKLPRAPFRAPQSLVWPRSRGSWVFLGSPGEVQGLPQQPLVTLLIFPSEAHTCRKQALRTLFHLTSNPRHMLTAASNSGKRVEEKPLALLLIWDLLVYSSSPKTRSCGLGRRSDCHEKPEFWSSVSTEKPGTERHREAQRGQSWAQRPLV